MTLATLRGVARLIPRTAMLALVAGSPFATAQQVGFARIQIDVNAGDIKLVGDIDLDGTRDVILGGAPGEGLTWYHSPDWTATRIAAPLTEFSTDGDIGDMDGDGDLDLVIPDGPTGDNLVWFENPARAPGGGRGNPFVPAEWNRRTIGTLGSWCKDVELADFDHDGRLDAATRDNDSLFVFFQEAGGFVRVTVPSAAMGHEGMASGDIDGDGDVDLVVQGRWLRNPGGLAARDGMQWQEFTIASSGVDPDFKALCADVDRDGNMDVLFSSSENTADVMWLSSGGNPTGTWTAHVIAANLNRAHTLQVADIDGDGDNDVVIGQMHTSNAPGVHVHYNQNGRGTSWQTQLVDGEQGIHNGVVADLDGDGDFEIVGSNWTGNPPLVLWENLRPEIGEQINVPPLTSGMTATVFVTHAQPTYPVFLCLTGRGAGTPYPVGGFGINFALIDPLLVGVAIAGTNGAAGFDLPIPWGLSGLRLWFQACEEGRVSPVVMATIDG